MSLTRVKSTLSLRIQNLEDEAYIFSSPKKLPKKQKELSPMQKELSVERENSLTSEVTITNLKSSDKERYVFSKSKKTMDMTCEIR